MHVDWNQASIDSNAVCRDGDDARRLRAVGSDGAVLPPRLERDLRARRHRLPAGRRRPAHARATLDNGQPTAIVYRTIKGWQYGIEGRPPTAPATSSAPTASTRRWRRCWTKYGATLPTCCDMDEQRCERRQRRRRSWRSASGRRSSIVRSELESERGDGRHAGRPARRGRERLDERGAQAPRRRARRSTRSTRSPRDGAETIPDELRLEPGSDDHPARRAGQGRSTTTTRRAAARSSSPPPTCSARPASTRSADGLPEGFYNAATNPERAAAVDRRHLRGRHGRHPVRPRRPTATTSASASSYGAFLAAARPHRRAAPRHRQPGAPGHRPGSPTGR